MSLINIFLTVFVATVAMLAAYYIFSAILLKVILDRL